MHCPIVTVSGRGRECAHCHHVIAASASSGRGEERQRQKGGGRSSLWGKHVVIVLLQHQHCQEEGEREREKGGRRSSSQGELQ